MCHVLHISKNSLKLKPSANYASTTEVINFLFFCYTFELRILWSVKRLPRKLREEEMRMLAPFSL
jgi:hypothetical protein